MTRTEKWSWLERTGNKGRRQAMEESIVIQNLLREICDVQREHLAEYKRVTQKSLELQQEGVRRQHEFARTYKRIALGGSVLVIFIIGLIIYLLGKFR